jgi:hypothetical protein
MFYVIFSQLVSRSRARSAARPWTTSCGFAAFEAIPIPGADSIFSSPCGAISGRAGGASSERAVWPAGSRVGFSTTSSRFAISATETPRFRDSMIRLFSPRPRRPRRPLRCDRSVWADGELSGFDFIRHSAFLLHNVVRTEIELFRNLRKKISYFRRRRPACAGGQGSALLRRGV